MMSKDREYDEPELTIKVALKPVKGLYYDWNEDFYHFD